MSVNLTKIQATELKGADPVHAELINLMQTNNVPPMIEGALTCFLFQVRDGVVSGAAPFDDPAETILTFLDTTGWDYAVIPTRVTTNGEAHSFSIVSRIA